MEEIELDKLLVKQLGKKPSDEQIDAVYDNLGKDEKKLMDDYVKGKILKTSQDKVTIHRDVEADIRRGVIKKLLISSYTTELKDLRDFLVVNSFANEALKKATNLMARITEEYVKKLKPAPTTNCSSVKEDHSRREIHKQIKIAPSAGSEDLVYRKLSEKHENIIADYVEVKVERKMHEERQPLRELRSQTQPFVIFSDGIGEKLPTAISNVRSTNKSVPFYVIYNIDEPQHFTGETAGSHWQFKAFENGNSEGVDKITRGDGACGCYTIIGIIACNTTLKKDEDIKKLLSETKIDIDKIGDNNFGTLGLSSKSARNFVASAVKKSDSLMRQTQIRGLYYWLEDQDIKDALDGLKIKYYSATSFIINRPDTTSVIRRNVISNLLQGSSEEWYEFKRFQTRHEEGRQVLDEIKNFSNEKETEAIETRPTSSPSSSLTPRTFTQSRPKIPSLSVIPVEAGIHYSTSTFLPGGSPLPRG
jgi:hypothetical protein